MQTQSVAKTKPLSPSLVNHNSDLFDLSCQAKPTPTDNRTTPLIHAAEAMLDILVLGKSLDIKARRV